MDCVGTNTRVRVVIVCLGTLAMINNYRKKILEINQTLCLKIYISSNIVLRDNYDVQIERFTPVG